MTIISKEEIDKQNALNYAFYDASKKALDKMSELKKADDSFTGTAEQVAADEELSNLVAEAKTAAVALDREFDAEKEFTRFLKRQARIQKGEKK